MKLAIEFKGARYVENATRFMECVTSATIAVPADAFPVARHGTRGIVVLTGAVSGTLRRTVEVVATEHGGRIVAEVRP